MAVMALMEMMAVRGLMALMALMPLMAMKAPMGTLSAKELSLPLPLVDPRCRPRICLFHLLERNHFVSKMIRPVDTMRGNIFHKTM